MSKHENARWGEPAGEFKGNEENELPTYCTTAFIIEALLACEEIWAALPGPAPLFARELLGALEIAESGEGLKSNDR